MCHLYVSVIYTSINVIKRISVCSCFAIFPFDDIFIANNFHLLFEFFKRKRNKKKKKRNNVLSTGVKISSNDINHAHKTEYMHSNTSHVYHVK